MIRRITGRLRCEFNYEKNEGIIAVITIIEQATIWQKDATFRGWVCVIN